jgi:hypothetical protein
MDTAVWGSGGRGGPADDSGGGPDTQPRLEGGRPAAQDRAAPPAEAAARAAWWGLGFLGFTEHLVPSRGPVRQKACLPRCQSVSLGLRALGFGV